MASRSNQTRSPVEWLLASLVVFACDPPAGTERIKDDTMLRQGARDDSRRNAVATAAIRDAKVVVLLDGTIELYDRHGNLRAQVLDPQARFVSTLEPITGTENWAKPHPYVTVPLPV